MTGDSEKIEVVIHEPCPQCADDFDNHCVIMTTEQPPVIGGVVLCPVPGCECFSTWSKDGTHEKDILVPPPDQLEQLRHAVQETYAS